MVMFRIFRGKYGLLTVARKCPCEGISPNAKTRHFTIWTCRSVERSKSLLMTRSPVRAYYARNFTMTTLKVLRGALKIRYVVIAGAASGGMTLHKKYTDLKDSFPDFTGSLTYIKDSVESKSKLLTQYDVRQWVNNKLQDAVDVAKSDRVSHGIDYLKKISVSTKEGIVNNYVYYVKGITTEDYVEEIQTTPFDNDSAHAKKTSSTFNKSSDRHVNSLQEEVIDLHGRYKEELNKLENENRELRKRNALLREGRGLTSQKKMKKPMIEMYSEVLDELSSYSGGTGGWSGTDHMPRVIVVGDQSAGKTSVLEMVAQARIFPRGAGEMMTRAPVKVTLSEGLYHVAKFKDSSREYDLTKESDLVELRREIELQMRNGVRRGCTVSKDVISLSVSGPGLCRMVLVDLPGIISTQTVGMANDTRDSIREMAELYMNNPNAIILCIQDGSIDAERSNVTDLVAQCDPSGKRTIFVLTKVDLAEENNSGDANKLLKILSGKLFPMKALGYFAVVTGSSNKDDSIQAIRDYEENFFKHSKLFQNGRIKMNQTTTRNLSLAVADCFWKMVHASIEQQADEFKATLFNLETEWKNNFPMIRAMDRDELFERARSEILDKSINLSMVPPREWEEKLMHDLWKKTSSHVFENIYLPAAITLNNTTFKTDVDIKLKEWAAKGLALKSVECAWEALQAKFRDFLYNDNAESFSYHDDIFNELKSAVVEETLRNHVCDTKAQKMIQVLQFIALQDHVVKSKRDWDEAVAFLESTISDHLRKSDNALNVMMGPSFKDKWLYWRSTTEEQLKRQAVRAELETLLKASGVRRDANLTREEITVIKKNLEIKNVEVHPDYIHDTWHPVYRKHFLKDALSRAYACKRSYYLYREQGEVECCDVILFWRIQQMMKVTANALRQHIINTEMHNLDKELKDVLDEFGQADDKKRQLLTGYRVTLADDLKRVRRIQEKLEEFITALNKEK